MAQSKAGTWWAGTLALAALTPGCAGAGASGSPPAPAADVAMAPTPEMIAEGGQIFGGAGRCAVCHGNGAVGGRFGPNLTDDDWAWIDPASPSAMEDVADLIRTGVTEPRVSDAGMPPMGGGNLTDGQLSALAAYILSL